MRQTRTISRAMLAALTAVLMATTAGHAKQAEAPVTVNSFSGAYLAARVAEADNDLDDAIAYYKRALNFDPDNQSMQQSLLLALLSDGQFEQALPYADKLKAVPEVERFSRLALAVEDFRKGRFQPAENMLKLALSSDLDRLISGLMTAWAREGAGDGKGALQALDALKGPEWYGIFKNFHRALIAEAVAMPAEADKAYEATLDDLSSAGTAPDTWLRASEAYAGFLARKGDKQKALFILDRADQFATGRVSINELRARINDGGKIEPTAASATDGASEVLLDVGSALNRGGGEPFVRLYLQLALALRPDSDATLIQLAAFAEQQEDAQTAIDLYRRIPAASPLRRAAQLQLGLNLADLKRHAEAESSLRQLLAEDPDDMRAYLALGGVYSSQEKYADAAKLYDEAVAHLEKPDAKVRTDGAQTANWNVYYQRGIAYERLKQWDKAEPSFREALKLAPDQPQVLNYLGYSLVDMNRNLEEALGMIQKAVDLRPSDGYIVDSLGWAYFRLNRFDEAVVQLERAVSLRPDDPVLNDHLGDGYWRVGRKLEATFQWRHARDLKPDADVLAGVLKKLKEGLPPVVEKATAEEPSSPPAPAATEPAAAVQGEERTDAAPTGEEPATASAAAVVPAAYTVQPGQSLWSIADDVLGDGHRYLEILKVNPKLQRNPSRLFPGEELVLPQAH